MRCCVPACKNDSRHISKSQGITFHVFPNEPSLRSSWLRALGKESWEPKERSAVCSDHFMCEDLYETKSGLRKVRAGAVPMVLQDAVCEFGEAVNLKVCCICLAVDGRLLSIRKYRLEEAYQHLTGLAWNDDKMPQHLCVECAQRLLSSERLRSKSLRAHSILMEIVGRQESLTLQSIATINRDNNRLTSNLSSKHFDPDHYDYQIDHEKDEKEIPICEVNISDEIDVKHENNDVFNGLSEVKQENNDVDDDNDRDFVASDRDYSTDDSLPLEARRKKKEKVKKNKIEKKEVIKKVRKRQVKKDPAQPKIDRRRKPFLNDELNETLFTITDLTHAEQLQEILKRQETPNYKNSVFKCEACYKGFLDQDAYNSHIIRHTDQCGEYECGICKTHFKHPHALRKHITAHHTQRFSCNQCPYVTTHRQTARLHERWHKGTKYQCPHCQDEFVKFTTYMGHIRIKHPSDFVCQLCGYSFVSEKGIELHKKLKHRLDDPQIPEDGPFCELCNVRFVSSDALRRHVHVSARHSGGDKDDKEPKSTKPRKSREANTSRERKRSRSCSSERRRGLRRPEGPIPCEQCGMQLEDSRAYHSHFRRMHPDKNRTNYPSMKSPCMCEVCGRMFQSYALLKDHTWTHTGERPFKCDACGKSFRMKQRLVAHRRVHSSQRATYVCTLCGKQFTTHSNRQRHMFIHTGLKPFKCEMCGKCFKHASEKRAHITYVHLKKPWPKRARGKRRPDTRQSRTGLQPFTCEMCGKCFKHASEKRAHITYVHLKKPWPKRARGKRRPDTRQSMQHPQMSVATSASEMDIVQPLWPSCDPKLADINAMMDDKPMYYNVKI